PDWAVAAGNPARFIRDRRVDVSGGDDLRAALSAFGDTARAQAAAVLARCVEDGGFVDRPSSLVQTDATAVRPWCDAIEIADLLLGGPPPGFETDDLLRRLSVGDMEEVLRQDRAFHEALAELSEHRFLTELSAQLRGRITGFIS